MARKSRSSKWADLDKHPFRILLAFAVLVGGTVFGVVRYFDSEKLDAIKRDYDAKITDYQGKLASIDRGLAGGGYINIASLVVHGGERARVPTQSKFYSDDSFYAPELAAWTYKKTTDKEFFTSMFGEEGKNKLMKSPE